MKNTDGLSQHHWKAHGTPLHAYMACGSHWCMSSRNLQSRMIDRLNICSSQTHPLSSFMVLKLCHSYPLPSPMSGFHIRKLRRMGYCHGVTSAYSKFSDRWSRQSFFQKGSSGLVGPTRAGYGPSGSGSDSMKASHLCDLFGWWR